MGPYVLASQLERAGFDVAVIDYFTRIPDFFEYLEQFLDSSTLFVGISSTFLSPAGPDPSGAKFDLRYGHSGLWLPTGNDLKEWVAKLRSVVRKHNPAAKIVLGGAKAVHPLKGWGEAGVFDFIGLSATDQSIVEFATSLKLGTFPKSYEHKSNLLIDNREELKNKRCPETILNSKYAIRAKESLPIEVSRGCVFNCKFCHFDKKESFRKDLATLRGEFLRNYELFGTTVYHFCDDCFNDSRKKVEEICTMILGLPFKIEWVSYARVDVAVRFPETMRLMVESGASGLFFGLESFNYTVARNAGKGTPPEKVKEFLIEAQQKYGDRCLLQGSFITGLPGETIESTMETIDWVTNNRALDFVFLTPLYISPAAYDQKIDKVSVDFSEYSRSPESHGFKKFDDQSAYWEHDTMNFDQAVDLASQFQMAWEAAGHKTFMRQIWEYPMLRTLGFTKNEIRDMALNEKMAEIWKREAFSRFANFTKEYWERLASTCGRKPEAYGTKCRTSHAQHHHRSW